tara:strand:- start:2277 stop:4922 length:2646 start_codon:yes stop_codon:yes gene_type:complete
MFTCRQPSLGSLARPQFSSSLQLEAQLKKCTEQTDAVVRALASSVDKAVEWSASHQRVVTEAFAVLASLPAHAELAKIERVQKQACELCKRLVAGIKRLGHKRRLFEVYDERVGALLARLLVQELYRPYRTCFPLADVLCILGELCLASPRTRAWAVERSASHQLAFLCEQESECPAVQKQAQIALCKLLYVGVDERYVFQSRFVDLLVDKTIEAPHDVERTAWVLTVLAAMQEKNERALEYIWRQSTVSRLIADVLSSDPCPENSSKIVCLLRFPASKPELRMLLARSGVWEVLHAIVGRADVNNMTLERFAEVFQHFAVCPVTGPLLVGVEAHHTLIAALKRVRNTDVTTADKLLVCAYNCCKQNTAFGAKIAGMGLLRTMHDMSVRAGLFTLSILLARYTGTCDGQDMQHILAREVHVLTGVLRQDTVPRSVISAEQEDMFTQEWVRFVHDARDQHIRALAPEVVQEFAAAVHACSKPGNICKGPALHLLARMLSCRTDVRVGACDVRTLAELEHPYTRAAVCTGLLALAGFLHDALHSGAAAKSEAGGSGSSGGAGIQRQHSPAAGTPDAGGGFGSTRAKHLNSPADASAENMAAVQEVRVDGTGTAASATLTDKDSESECSTDNVEPEWEEYDIGLTTHDLEQMDEAFPKNLEVIGMLLWLYPVFYPARLDRLCDMFVAVFEGKRGQCLLAMDVIDSLLPWHPECALRLAFSCGLEQLWITVEKRMPHCGEQASVEYIDTFARLCQRAKKTDQQHVLDTLLELPFYAMLITHLERTVAVRQLQLANALVALLHTVLDVQANAGAVLLLGGAALKLVRVRNALAAGAGTGARLSAEIGGLVPRIVPEEHAAQLAGLAEPREESRKRKLEEYVSTVGQ